MVSFPTRAQNAAIAFAKNIPNNVIYGAVVGSVYGYFAGTPIGKTVCLFLISLLASSAIRRFAGALSENTRTRCCIGASVNTASACAIVALMRHHGIFGRAMTAQVLLGSAGIAVGLLYIAARITDKESLEQIESNFLSKVM